MPRRCVRRRRCRGPGVGLVVRLAWSGDRPAPRRRRTRGGRLVLQGCGRPDRRGRVPTAPPCGRAGRRSAPERLRDRSNPVAGVPRIAHRRRADGRPFSASPRLGELDLARTVGRGDRRQRPRLGQVEPHDRVGRPSHRAVDDQGAVVAVEDPGVADGDDVDPGEECGGSSGSEPGTWSTASSSTWGKPSTPASRAARRDLPEPALPTTDPDCARPPWRAVPPPPTLEESRGSRRSGREAGVHLA